MATDTQLRFPDGIVDDHVQERGRLARHANPLSILVLGGMVLVALLGVFGGGHARPITLSTAAAEVSVTTPRTLRNGLFFETRVGVTAKSDIKNLVIAVPPALWRDMTINTMIPAAAEESFKRDAFRFSYGPLAKGERIALKIDGQINPPLFAGTSGRIAVLDGDHPIGEIPVDIAVLP